MFWNSRRRRAGIIILSKDSEPVQKLIHRQDCKHYYHEDKLKIAGSFFVDVLLWDLEEINEAEGEYKYEVYKNIELNSLAIIRTKKE